jgi:hypothetical protein
VPMRLLIVAALLMIFSQGSLAREIYIQQLGLILEPADYEYPAASQPSAYNLKRSRTFMRVAAIDSNSPFFLAGLQPGDMVTNIRLASQGRTRSIGSESFRDYDKPGTIFYEMLNNLLVGGPIRIELELNHRYSIGSTELYTKEYAFNAIYEPFDSGGLIRNPVFDAQTAEFSFGEPWQIVREDHPQLARSVSLAAQRAPSEPDENVDYENCEAIRFGDEVFYVGYTETYFHYDYYGDGQAVFNQREAECSAPKNLISNIFSFRRNVSSFGSSNNDILYVRGDICSNQMKLVGFHTEDTSAFLKTIFDPSLYKAAYINDRGRFEITTGHVRAYYDRYRFPRDEEIIRIRPHQYFELLYGREFELIPEGGLLLDNDLSDPAKIWNAVAQSYVKAMIVRDRICDTPLSQISVEARVAVQAGYFIPTARERSLAGLTSDGYLSFLLTRNTIDVGSGRVVASEGASIVAEDFFSRD